MVVEDQGERHILADGVPVTYLFRCNPLYTPTSVRLRSESRVEAQLAPVPFEIVAPNRIQFDLPGLPDGRYRLQIEMSDPTDNVRLQDWAMDVMRGYRAQARVVICASCPTSGC